MTASAQGMFDQIPVIDVNPLLDGTDAGLRYVADQIAAAYSQVGFSYITGHGVSPALIDGIFQASADFHALPREEKLKIEVNEFHRGFIPINTSTAVTSTIEKARRPNQSESFIMMHELPADDPDVLAGAPLAGPNQWPASLPGFRTAVRAYHAAVSELARKLVRGVAVALGAAPDFLDPYFIRPTTFLRLLFYPPQAPESPDDVFGSAPHTDYGFITILLQDNVGGLQVRNLAGEWIDAPYRPGAFVMNAGDILHCWSNGCFISTPHRVINRSGRARYSNAFFFDPDMRAHIEPLPSCVNDKHPTRLEPLVYGEFLMNELRANHVQHQDRARRM
jgi:isopenicillin N synthase-like dioxygenase